MFFLPETWIVRPKHIISAKPPCIRDSRFSGPARVVRVELPGVCVVPITRVRMIRVVFRIRVVGVRLA